METKIFKPTKFQQISRFCSILFCIFLIFLIIQFNNFSSILNWILNLIMLSLFSFGLFYNFFQIIFSIPYFEINDNYLIINDLFKTKKYSLSGLQISFYNEKYFWGYIKFNDHHTSNIILKIDLSKKFVNEIKNLKENLP
mgnify:CR=1 FL=1